MSINVFQVGDMIRLSAAFTDIADASQDPGGVVFKLREPDNSLTTYTFGVDGELVKDAVGNYHVDWLIAQQGRHRYRFEGVTSGQAAAERSFRAEASAVD